MRLIDQLKKGVKRPRLVIDFFLKRGILNWLNDRTYLKIIYRYKLGKKLHLNNPQSFNEKLQWLKINDRKSIYTTMVDKYAVKQYVADMIGNEYIIPTLGVWDDFNEIDFNSLPNQFVLKCTHDSGGIVICRDKNIFDIKNAKRKLEKSLNNNYYWYGREWPYKNVKPRILAEKYMTDEVNNFKINGTTKETLIDYKFYCFDGEPKYLYVSEGLEEHSTASISFLTLDWNFAPFGRKDYKPFDRLPAKPVHYDKMMELAKIMSTGYPFLRVDFYEINKEIYFSEFTFTPCSGMMPFTPDNWDNKLGELINLSV